MKTIVAVVLVMALLPIVAVGQEWTRVWPRDCRCFISTPGEFEGTTERENLRFIGPVTFTMFKTKIDGVVYGIGWVDYHEPMKLTVQGELRANRDNFLREFGGRHIKTIAISLRQKPGIHFTAEARGTLVTSRVYVVGQRAYMLFVLSPKSEDHAKNIDRFLGSFDFSTAR